VKDFKIAAKAAITDADKFTFKVGDVDVTSLRPSEGQVVMLLAAQASEVRSDESRIAGVVDGILALFDEGSARYLGGLLMKGDLPFETDNDDDASLMGIAMDCLEEWGQRPTKPLSDSTSSSESTGTTSAGGVSEKELASSAST
jgi:hypothetical protein